MSALARSLLLAGVLLGVAGTGIYVNDTWIDGDGGIEAPRGLAGTCLALALILVGVGLRAQLRTRRR